MKRQVFAIGHAPIPQHVPFVAKKQPLTEGTVDGSMAKSQSDMASRTAQPAYQVKKSPARARESLGLPKYGRVTRKKGKR